MADDWLRHLECVVCLEVTSQPVRLWHQPPLHADCGVVLCPPCAAHWRRSRPGGLCPRCRAELVSTDVFGPVLPPDALLVRLLRDLLPAKGVPVPPPAPVLPPPPRPVEEPLPERQPVSLEAMQALTAWLSRVLGGELAVASPHWWGQNVVTSTTGAVDDREAARLPRQSAWLWGELDATLNWSRRLAWPAERTVRVLVNALRRLTPLSPPDAGAAGPWVAAWADGLRCDRRGVLFVRTLVAVLVALQRWCRFAVDAPRERDAVAGRALALWRAVEALS